MTSPNQQDVAALVAEPVAWQTRGMTIRNEWAGWVPCSEAQARSWERDVSFRIGRREVRGLYDATALSTLAAERETAQDNIANLCRAIMGAEPDPAFDLRPRHFVQMANDLHSAVEGRLASATAMEAERDGAVKRGLMMLDAKNRWRERATALEAARNEALEAAGHMTARWKKAVKIGNIIGDEKTALEAQLAKAREALKPFADLGVGSGPDDEYDNQPYRILRGAIRRARSVLEG